MPGHQDSIAVLVGQVSTRLFQHATKKRFKSRASLFQSGDYGDGCYRIESGVVKIILNSREGEERIVSLEGPGSVIGELSLIDGMPRSASAVAVRDCEVLFVSRERFVACTQRDPKIFECLATMLALRLREADEATAASSFMSVKARLARAFLDLAKHLGQRHANGRIQLNQRVSQRDIAALAGVARENVSRTLSGWNERKLITQSSRHYCIENASLLLREINFAAH